MLCRQCGGRAAEAAARPSSSMPKSCPWSWVAKGGGRTTGPVRPWLVVVLLVLLEVLRQRLLVLEAVEVPLVLVLVLVVTLVVAVLLLATLLLVLLAKLPLAALRWPARGRRAGAHRAS